MEKLFGIDMTTIALVMSGLFGLIFLFVLSLALRHRVLFRMGIRNLPRRRQETALIVVGLMLATTIMSAAFGTGDTLAHTIRTQAIQNLGEIDEIVRITGSGSGEQRADYFPISIYDQIQEATDGSPDVEAVVPAIFDVAPVLAPDARLSVPQAAIAAADPETMAALKTPNRVSDGTLVSLADLGPTEVYISEEAADDLEAEAGDVLQVFFGPVPTSVTVKDVVSNGAWDVYLPLERLQGLLDKEGEINRVWVSNTGGPLAGAERSEAVQTLVEPLLEDTSVELELQKQDALDEAELVGSAFTSIFVVFGLFSIAAGVLLIFLIFIMLAAERKPEMGMARAVGMQRRHLIQTFLMEGAVYDLIAATVGAGLGILVSFGLVRIMAVAFGASSDGDVNIAFNIQPRSILVAATLGIVLTFIVVTVSAWRVSILNIVRAIRDLPEPRLRRRSRRAAIVSAFTLLIGILLTVVGLQTAILFVFTLGVSLAIIGGSLLARRFGVPDRAVFTFAGVALLVFWLLPPDALGDLLPEFTQGLEMFFLSGIMMVAGAVWTVMYNADLLIGLLIRLAGSSRKLAPILKMSASYPLHSRFRTGMTLAMFALVVFTIIFMAVIIDVNSLVLRERDRITGGADIYVTTSQVNPIPDLPAAILADSDLDAALYQNIGGVSALSAKFHQVDAEETEFTDWLLRGADDGYLTDQGIGFRLMTEDYESPDEVWEAVRTTPGLAVVDSFVVPAQNNFNIIVGGTQFQLEGLFLEDETMEPIQVEIEEPFTGKVSTVTIIAVLDDLAFFSSGMYVSQQTLAEITPAPPAPNFYFMGLPDGTDQDQAAKALESSFLEHGAQAEVIDEVLNEQLESSRTLNGLLQGFMALGLVVGIAALGVISARAVVERRRQIGALRAIGFQKGMVMVTFLLESSFIAMLGIALGVALGLSLSYVVVGSLLEDLGVQNATFQVPWATVVTIIVVSYVASFLTTAYPAWQASRVYPAEALRYE